jgi:bile-acid 7alpha-dehydratase
MLILAHGHKVGGACLKADRGGGAMVDLNELEAIKRLKYKYQRCLDQKRWAELAECFTEDATSSYGDGKYSYEGRDAIVAFLSTAMPSTMLTSHRVHEPEIDLTSETTAKGIWAMEDTVIETKGEFTIRGAAFYNDEYVKVNGEWKIKSTGYQRIYEEFQSRKDSPSLKILEKMFD